MQLHRVILLTAYVKSVQRGTMVQATWTFSRPIVECSEEAAMPDGGLMAVLE